MNNPFELLDRRLSLIETLLLEIKHTKTKGPEVSANDDPLNDFIPKQEVRGKLASSATLWQWEKAGKIKSYGIGGKRFYKRSELTAAIKPVK